MVVATEVCSGIIGVSHVLKEIVVIVNDSLFFLEEVNDIKNKLVVVEN